MKILFVMRHSGYVRNFESTLRLLAERGHTVEVAFQNAETHWLLDATDMTSQLCAQYPSMSRSNIPERLDAWGQVARELRATLDYLRYLAPRYRQATKLRERAARDVPAAILERTAAGPLATAAGRRLFTATLRQLHAAIPSDPRIDAYLEARRPDLLVVTPLIQPGAPQSEYLRSARSLGIRTALCVASWDNLTNKGVIHGHVDLVTVWNEMMKSEAVTLHGVPPERVVVTGAQPFDHWFAWRARASRGAFCDQVRLPADQPYVLYLCSSKFIAPDESAFVRKWLDGLRNSAHPALRRAGVLIRPHPQNADQWNSVDLSGLGPVAVWPAHGAAPSDQDSRADYFDSIVHSAAVVGINTTAEIESAIIGRRVYSVLAPEFRDTQEGTLHFSHLKDVNGGLLRLAQTMPEHFDHLDEALRDPHKDEERCRRFVEAFVRPFGLDSAATPRLVGALERLGEAPVPVPAHTPRWAALVQPALARRGEQLHREACLAAEVRALRIAAKARRKKAVAAQR